MEEREAVSMIIRGFLDVNIEVLAPELMPGSLRSSNLPVMEKSRWQRRNIMELTEIGKVQSEYNSTADHFEMRKKESRILIYDEFIEGLY